MLGQEGDWTRVALGLNGPEGWMMTRYLAFGSEMDEVEPAFLSLMYVLELEERQPAYSAPHEGPEKELAGNIYVVGVVAVSYTHLDVYKRQGARCSSRR